MILPGKYKARVKNYGIKAVKSGEHKGEPAPTIAFELIETGEVVFWQGSFNLGKARDFTMTALSVCGLSSVNSLINLADGLPGGALDPSKEVEIDVINETYNDKTFAKVAWVNEVGGKGLEDLMPKATFAGYIQRMGLASSFIDASLKRGIDATRKQAPTPVEDGTDIPF